MASQKTLSVAALIVPQLLKDAAGDTAASRAGMAMVAIVFVYLAQLALDSLISSAWTPLRHLRIA